MCLQDVRKCSTNIIRKRIYLWQRPSHDFSCLVRNGYITPHSFSHRRAAKTCNEEEEEEESGIQGWCKSIRIRLCNNEQSRLQQSVLTCYSDPPDIAPKSYTCTNMPLITNNNNKGESFPFDSKIVLQWKM